MKLRDKENKIAKVIRGMNIKRILIKFLIIFFLSVLVILCMTSKDLSFRPFALTLSMVITLVFLIM